MDTLYQGPVSLATGFRKFGDSARYRVNDQVNLDTIYKFRLSVKEMARELYKEHF